MPISGEAIDGIVKSTVERVVFETVVTYEDEQEMTLYGKSRDLSVGGLYLETKTPLNIDDIVTVTFSLNAPDFSITCTARVAWRNYENNRCKPNYITGVGLQFLELKQGDLSVLTRFIDGYDTEKKMNVVCAWCGNCLGMRKGPFGTTSHGICSQCLQTVSFD